MSGSSLESSFGISIVRFEDLVFGQQRRQPFVQMIEFPLMCSNSLPPLNVKSQESAFQFEVGGGVVLIDPFEVLFDVELFLADVVEEMLMYSSGTVDLIGRESDFLLQP